MRQNSVIVIGGGISGLVDAILMAKAGRKVTVLEQHTIPGGYLQQFRRKGTWFDVGFHYLGSTAPGRPMRQFLEHLDVWNRLELIPFPEESAILVVKGERSFGYPATWDRFMRKARSTWPGQGQILEKLFSDVERVTSSFRWLDLRRGVNYLHPLDLDFEPISLAEYMGRFIEDPWLRQVLSFQGFNLGLFPEEVPWVKFMLAFRSNFDVTSRVRGGGGALVKALVDRGRELGVDLRLGAEVVEYECAGRHLKSVALASGERFAADLFLAACNPKEVLGRIADDDLRPLFKERILEMRDSRGAVQLFLRLDRPVEELGPSCVMLQDESAMQEDPPIHTVLITQPSLVEGAGPPRLEAMTYMDHEPFKRWAGTTVMKRGEEYERFKQRLAERMLRLIERRAPGISGRILDRYVSTPLTDEWYTRNPGGGVFGISHDIGQQGMHRPQPRVRLKNLFFTGHSIQMPGICGVFINAFDTCSSILQDEGLLDAVAT
ncbi:MAG: NAD(P)/FAD-dependent oxidoreductase [Planctomycetota bacterium]